MSKLNEFEYMIKSRLDIVMWECSEGQLLLIAKNISKSGKEPSDEQLYCFIKEAGVNNYINDGSEGLDLKEMYELLKIANEITNKSTTQPKNNN